MKSFFSSTLLVLSVFLIGCSKNDDDQISMVTADSVIFGKVYGNCAGDCRTLFLITETELFEDTDEDEVTTENYGNWQDTTFKTEPLSNANFNLAKSLVEVPESIFSFEGDINTQTLIDVDNYIRIEANGQIRSYNFDDVRAELPEEIRDYLKMVKRVTMELRKN